MNKVLKVAKKAEPIILEILVSVILPKVTKAVAKRLTRVRVSHNLAR